MVKKARRRRKTSRKTWEVKIHHDRISWVLICVAFIFLIGAAVSLLYIRARKLTYRLETPRNEVRKLPPEIKRRLTYASPSASFRIPVLMYHYVEYVQDPKDKIRMGLDVIPRVFEGQMKTLRDAGYTFMTAKELGDVLDGKKQLPTQPLLITFDDGHWDLYTDALPILQKYNIKATAYIIPGFLGGSDFLSVEQLKKVSESGLVEIGAHTVHHVWLKNVSRTEAQVEISESKTMLEKLITTPVVSFAYPYGAFDAQAAQLVKDAGFETAVSTVPGVEVNQNDRYFIYRLRPGGRTGEELLHFLNQPFPNPY